MGVQSFSERKLRVLGRRHRVEQSERAIENLRRAGYRYINIDLMYLTTGKTLDEWRRDPEAASEKPVDEITCYPTLVVPSHLRTSS
ncbi:MAG: hypothetical protein DRO39_07575 [Thermoprotei archaeon]|nr:MAG: hypothetical protein DRO39_07575 [Thermoprotei archaeon]